MIDADILSEAIEEYEHGRLGSNLNVIVAAARKYENLLKATTEDDDAAPATNADVDLAHRFQTIRVGGPTADGRVHLNGSLSSDEWGRLHAALGITTEDDG